MKLNLEKRLAKSVDILLLVLMSLMFMTVCLQVFFRYVLEQPLSWSEEFARYAFVWVSFLGAAMSLGKRLHFGIDFFVNKFPARLSAGLEVGTHLLILIFVLVIIVKGYETMLSAAGMLSAGLNLRMDAVFAAIPVSGLIMAYYVIRQTVEAFIKMIGRKDPATMRDE
jgi:TRAP-type C4-dicarboxylate transport system permease small subunit